MKAIFYAAWLLAVGILIVGCEAGSAPIDFRPVPWADGSTANYEWADGSGVQIGASQLGFSLQDDAWVITNADQIGQFEQTSAITISATTLAPLGEYKTIQSPGTDVELTTSYQDGQLDIQAVVNGEVKTARMSVPDNALDNDQLLMTLRALPFAEGYEARCVVIVPQNALQVKATVIVRAQEQVVVPAGAFQAWRVELDFGQASQFAWYGVDPPHMLVQYDNGTNRMLLAP